MSDYISRQVAIEWFMPYLHMEEKIPAETVLEDLRNLPAADVAPAVHGEWGITNGQIENAVCSCCGTHFQAYYSDYQYCPRCGAKMDRKEKENE